MNKSPAFQFYTDDWLGSTKIMLMTPEQEGAYIRLLAIAWNADDCGLPNDDEQLAVLSRMGEGWLNGGSERVRACFFVKGERLLNQRLLDERKKQRDWRKKSSEGGKASAAARAKVRRDNALTVGKGGSTTVPTNEQPKVNSPSSSTSPSTPTSTGYSKEFLSFYQLFPHHKAKKKAAEAFTKARKSITAETIMDGVRRLNEAIEKRWEDVTYVPKPPAWLNGCRWDDEYTAPKDGQKSTGLHSVFDNDGSMEGGQ